MSNPGCKIQIHYFAILREFAGKESEEYTTFTVTARDLYEELNRNYTFNIDPAMIKVAINDAFSDWHTTLKDGDRVVFIPPVAGG